MGLVFWLVFPGIALLVLECLIVSLTNVGIGRFVIPALAIAAFAITLLGSAAAMGWDSLGWGVLAMVAGSGLLGALFGLIFGQLFRHLRRRKPE